MSTTTVRVALAGAVVPGVVAGDRDRVGAVGHGVAADLAVPRDGEASRRCRSSGTAVAAAVATCAASSATNLGEAAADDACVARPVAVRREAAGSDVEDADDRRGAVASAARSDASMKPAIVGSSMPCDLDQRRAVGGRPGSAAPTTRRRVPAGRVAVGVRRRETSPYRRRPSVDDRGVAGDDEARRVDARVAVAGRHDLVGRDAGGPDGERAVEARRSGCSGPGRRSRRASGPTGTSRSCRSLFGCVRHIVLDGLVGREQVACR